MAQPKFKEPPNGEGDWTIWVCPSVKKNYRMQCCDCGLVHEMQFRTFVEGNKVGDGFEMVTMPKEIRATFRVRRWNPKKSAKRRKK